MSLNPQRVGRRLKGLERWRQESLPAPYWLEEYPVELTEGGILHPATTHLGVPLGSPVARLYASASSQYSESAYAAVTGYPVTLAAWIKPTATTANTILGVYASAGTASWNYIYSGTRIYANSRGGGSNNQAYTPELVQANQWCHACGVFYSPNSRAAFYNGGNKGTNASPITLDTLDRTTIGARRWLASLAQYFDGALTLPAIWNCDLTDGEVYALAHGKFPWEIKPQNLVYVGLIPGHRDDLDYSGHGYHMTPYNGPTWDAGPSILTPQSRIWRIGFEPEEETTPTAIVRPAIRGITVPRSDLDKGVVGEWPCKPATGDRLLDLSGYRNHAIITPGAGSWISTDKGIAYEWDGADTVATVSPSASLDDIFAGGGSVEIFLRLDSWVQTYPRIMHKGTANTAPDGWTLYGSNFGSQSNLRFEVAWDGSGSGSALWSFPSACISLGQWFHLIVAYDRNSVDNNPTGYVDGISKTLTENRAPVGAYVSDSGDNLYIGSFGSAQEWDGPIALVRLHNRALTQPEVSARYQQVLGRAQEPQWMVWKIAYALEEAAGYAERGTARGVIRGLLRGV